MSRGAGFLLASNSREEVVERYLSTGIYDDHDHRAFPGNDFLARVRHGHAALRDALVDEVLGRAGHVVVPKELLGLDVVGFTRTRVAPMVHALFPRSEQEVVFEVLGRSVVFLTAENIEAVLRDTKWHHTAWSIANPYLAA